MIRRMIRTIMMTMLTKMARLTRMIRITIMIRRATMIRADFLQHVVLSGL